MIISGSPTVLAVAGAERAAALSSCEVGSIATPSDGKSWLVNASACVISSQFPLVIQEICEMTSVGREDMAKQCTVLEFWPSL